VDFTASGFTVKSSANTNTNNYAWVALG